MSGHTAITIAICTRNRAAFLAKALRSVLAQADAGTEVLIVDNGSTDETAALVAGFSAADARVKKISEPQTGLSIARNTALRSARGEWVIFLDDDAEAGPGWFSTYQKFFSALPEARIATVGGAVIPHCEKSAPKWLGNIGWMDLGPEPFCFPRGKSPWETNCAIRREAALQAGGFDVNLGHRGDTAGYREGVDLTIRLQDLGYQIWWLPGAPIRHFVHANRLNLRWVFNSAFNEGRSVAIHRLKSRTGGERILYICGRVLFAPLHCVFNLLAALVTLPFKNGTIAAKKFYRAIMSAGLMRGLLEHI